MPQTAVRPEFPAPPDFAAVLREHNASERRMVEEYNTAYDFAQKALEAPKPLVDEDGVAFAVDQTVETFREISFASKKPGVRMKNYVAGMRGVIVHIGETNATIRFESIDEPYLIRCQQMHRVLRVVG